MSWPKPKKLSIGSHGSVVVDECQVCASTDLKSILFVGFLPPVNTMQPIGTRPQEQPSYPAEVLMCQRCKLAQIGLIVDPNILFPPHYAYTSGTTKILRENFTQMYEEVMSSYPLKKDDLVVDIGGNDGTLLSNFQANHRVFCIEPTNAGLLARNRGIETLTAFFDAEAVNHTLKEKGKAKLITITNCFAHMEDVHTVVEGVMNLLTDDGIFLTESHYLLPLVETVQYDTVYHEHLRYYSVESLKYLLEMHGLEIIRAKRIPTHRGSVRVYSARKGKYPVDGSVAELLRAEKVGLSDEALSKFKEAVVNSKLGLHALLKDIKAKGERVYAVGAPSRAATLVNYVGLDAGILDCVLEIKGSYKIDKYMPGTVVPVFEESRLFTDQPEYALMLSWHIADELMPKLISKGYKGKFIVPLPVPKVVARQHWMARTDSYVDKTL
ncbi:MAG: methyltransferase domain-containing protein [Deltaproteobacteria bacterium]|nr:methyltransferase domain-containing protein [Deltaproteobacteria bacterium]